MRRGYAIWLMIAILALSACGGQPAPAATDSPLDLDSDATAVATSAVPTAVASADGAFPNGTLIVTQLGRPLAQLPGRQSIALTDERFGAQASPNGRYGVRLTTTTGGTALELVDYATNPPAVTAIPEGRGLRGPGITWKPDSSGFAFFDFPPFGQQAGIRSIYYFDVARGQSARLIPDMQRPNQIPISVSFSPDGAYLLYVIGDAEAEGIGGPGSTPYILTVASGQSAPLPPDTLFGPVQWLNDNSGFLVLRRTAQAADQSGVFRYNLNALNNPQRLTPPNTTDLLMDISADGRWVAVTSTGDTPNNPANIYMMALDGSNRRRLTDFADPEQSITGLVWAADGIYYSLSSADGLGTVWRMDLDGRNATQIGTGTLHAVIGAG